MLSRWLTGTTCARSAPVDTRAASATAPIVELQLAGGDLLSDVSLLKDEATRRLRGSHALPSHTTLFRFLAGADLGRVMRAQAVNRQMLRRSWAMGAAPTPGRLTIDPDATYIDTSGKAKEGSRFSYKISWPMPPRRMRIGSCPAKLGFPWCERARLQD